MAKNGPRPPANTPAGKRLTKRERAQAIARWAENLAPLKAAKDERRACQGDCVVRTKACRPDCTGHDRENRPEDPATPVAQREGQGETTQPPVSDLEKRLFHEPSELHEPTAPKKRTPKPKKGAPKTPLQGKTAKPPKVSAPAGKVSPDTETATPVEPVQPVESQADTKEGEGSSTEQQQQVHNQETTATAAPDSQEAEAEEPAADPTCPTYSTLDAKHQRFVEEYIVDNNGAAAARRANYSANCAKQIAHELLTKPDLQTAIAEKRAELAARHQITKDQIIAELRASGFANQADYVRVTSDGEPYIDLSMCSREQLSALQSVSVEDYVEGRGEDSRQVKRVMIKTVDKLRALKELADLLGFSPKKQVEHSGGVKVETSAKADPLAERIKRLDTETLRELKAVARRQEEEIQALLNGAAPATETSEPTQENVA